MMKLFNILKCLLNNTIPCPVTHCTDILNTFLLSPYFVLLYLYNLQKKKRKKKMTLTKHTIYAKNRLSK